jgi:hypothetical protein
MLTLKMVPPEMRTQMRAEVFDSIRKLNAKWEPGKKRLRERLGIPEEGAL